MRAPAPRTINLLVALLCLLWGSTWVVIREGLEHLPAFTSAGVRFLLAGLVMFGIALVIGRKEGGAAPRPLLWISLGTLNFATSYGIVYWTEETLPSGLVAVLWGVFPMMMAASGHFFLPGEQLRGVQWSGFGVAFVGLALLFLTDLKEFARGGIDGAEAAAILLLSPLVSAASTTVIKKYGEGTNSTLLNRNGMLLGAALLLIAGAVFEREEEIRWTGTAIFSIVYLAIGGTVVTFGIYFWLLRYADAYKLSLIAYVTPVIALILGWVVKGESVTWFTVLGTALILSGVIAVMRGKAVKPSGNDS